jgi:hypothetical protein
MVLVVGTLLIGVGMLFWFKLKLVESIAREALGQADTAASQAADALIATDYMKELISQDHLPAIQARPTGS